MKKPAVVFILLLTAATLMAQSPQKMSYQAVIRDASGKLVKQAPVGMRISILQGSSTGTVVYTETHLASTNLNGLLSIAIGAGTSTGQFSSINWAEGPYFLKTETDPAGSTNYTINGVTQLLSVPFALYAQSANVDGSETKIEAGANIQVTGSGTIPSPYVITSPPNVYPYHNQTTITASQSWSVPPSVSKIKVELWGAAGGGGGAGTYSYSYNLNNGGNGGSGGFAEHVLNVTENQQFLVVIGIGGSAGTNAVWNSGGWHGDTDGGRGGDSWFGEIRAAGGTGGKKGSFSPYTTHGTAGTSNTGAITAYADNPQSQILNIFQGVERSYIFDRVLTSKPGKGGSNINSYSIIIPTQGEGGCAIITVLE